MKALSQKFYLTIAVSILLCLLSLQSGSQTAPNEARPVPGGESQTVQNELYKLEPSGFTFPNWGLKREGLLRFSLENKALKNFNQLKPPDIRVTLDDHPVTLPENALRLTETNPLSVFILIDGSKSMLGRSQGVDKLRAAKSAILSLIDNLEDKDLVGVYAFDSSLYEVAPLTSDKSDVKDKVENLVPREGKVSLKTELYGSIEELLLISGREKVQSIVLVSDGMQDTDESVKYQKNGFNEYKSQKETQIRQNISRSGTRIFSIAIGDENSLPALPSNSDYVDRKTLSNIGEEASGGYSEYVDLPELKERSETENVSYQKLLEDKLKAILEKIKSNFRYGYELTVPIEEKNLDKNQSVHELVIEFTVSKSILTFKQNFTLGIPSARDPNPPPDLNGRGIVTEPRFIVFSPTTEPPSLLLIYLPIAGLISVLGFLPAFVGNIRRRVKQRSDFDTLKNVIQIADKNSFYLGLSCPNKDTILEGQPIILCPNCKKPHHIWCWELNNHRCFFRHTCSDRLIIPQQILDDYDNK